MFIIELREILGSGQIFKVIRPSIQLWILSKIHLNCVPLIWPLFVN